MSRARYDQTALSIIELIVVFVIIAILVGIIIPAIFVARERARRTVCVNNLQQLGVAIVMYTQDFGGYYPPGAELGGAAQPLSRLRHETINALYPAYVSNPNIFYCPGCENRLWERINVSSLTSWSLAKKQGVWKSAELDGDTLISYIYIPNAYDANFRAGGVNPRTISSKKNIAIMADQFIETSPNDRFCNHDLPRAVGSNVLYNDWHVKWRRIEQMASRYVTSTGWRHYW